MRAGASVARVTAWTVEADGTEHTLEVGFAPGEPKSIRVDDAPVENLSTSPARPLASVFLPERLELVKGAPASRRAHMDRFVAAVWPARAAVRTAYSRALSQRNALLGADPGRRQQPGHPGYLGRRAGATRAPADGRPRARRSTLLAPRFAELGTLLGPPETWPSWSTARDRAAGDAAALAAELAERRGADLERGFTAHGPHRDDLRLLHGGRSLRQYGSQGQQRVALLALLFAERDVLRDRARHARR